MIDYNNYEEYVLDFLEGGLSDEMQIQMQSFLDENPIIKEEVSDLLDYSLPLDESVVYEGKEDLKKDSAGYFYWIMGAVICLLLVTYLGLNNGVEKNVIPNNEIEEYKISLPQKEAKNDVIYADVDNEKAETIEEIKSNDINVNNTMAKSEINQFSKDNTKRNKVALSFVNDGDKVLVGEDSGKNKITTIEINENIIEEEVIASIKEDKESKKVNPLDLDQKPVQKIEFLNTQIKYEALVDVDVSKLILENTKDDNSAQFFVVSVKLGRFAKTRKKLKTFLQNERVVAVKDALLPEYFARN